MASLAPGSFTTGTRLQHALLELSLVRVGMTGGTGKIIPMIEDRRLGLDVRILFVAIAARYRDMASGQYEMSFLVPSQGEGRWLESLQVVATLTRVEVRRCNKLAGMLIAVAISAMLELDLEQRVFALGSVALIALHGGVLPLQRISRRRVVFHRELSGLEALHRMAGGALAASGPLGELPVVRIGLVTINTPLEGQRLLEVSAGVALHAFNRGVLAQQGIPGLRVIEALADRSNGNLFPSSGGVAGLAALDKTSVVRIGVAIRALAEGDVGVVGLIVRPQSMTPLASHLGV